jgi:hypothetical protein
MPNSPVSIIWKRRCASAVETISFIVRIAAIGTVASRRLTTSRSDAASVPGSCDVRTTTDMRPVEA